MRWPWKRRGGSAGTVEVVVTADCSQALRELRRLRREVERIARDYEAWLIRVGDR